MLLSEVKNEKDKNIKNNYAYIINSYIWHNNSGSSLKI